MGGRYLSGQGAGVLKYDVLTALIVMGLNGTSAEQISMSRLAALITARYNWKTDTLTIGQKEMSEIWGIGDRTVKREVRRWLDAGLMICVRPGVKGRVASYRLNVPRLCEMTRPIWDAVGPDFAERMEALAPNEARVIRLETVRPTEASEVSLESDDWAAVLDILQTRFPAQHAAWLTPLQARRDEDRLVLEARSAFAAEYIKTHFGRDIIDAVSSVWVEPVRVVIRGASTRQTAN